MMSKRVSNNSPVKRETATSKKMQKTSEYLSEDACESSSYLSLPVSKKNKEHKVKSSLKGETEFKLNKALSKKPKKNITAYAFYIKEVSIADPRSLCACQNTILYTLLN